MNNPISSEELHRAVNCFIFGMKLSGNFEAERTERSFFLLPDCLFRMIWVLWVNSCIFENGTGLF